MRPRYLLLSGLLEEDRVLAIQERLLACLPRYLAVGAMHMFVTPGTPVILLPRSEGILVGTLFENSTSRRVDHIPPSIDHAVTSTQGAILIERYWGSYVAIWTDPGRGIRLLRDPSGAVPAYWHGDAPELLVTSDVGLAVQTGLFRAQIDWECLNDSLMFPELADRRTAIAGLADTIPGICHMPHDDRAGAETIWSPARFAATGVPLAASFHTEKIHTAVERTVASWRACFNTVALELSGGLDSSIVAAALTSTERDWTGLTFATDRPDGDERPYARAVADHCRACLREVRLTFDATTVDAPYGRLTPRPRGTSYLGSFDRAMTQARDALGVEATFTGLGGDHVFFLTQSTAPVLDALFALGPRAARETATDVARLCGAPLAQVYRAAMRRAWTHRGLRRWPADRRYLSASTSRQPLLHPWLDLPRHAPHGTRARIALLLRALGLLDGVDRMVTRTTISPLLSQPVIEACLAVPSWLCVLGGRDRAVARNAFAAQLPDRVIRRQGKGRVDSLLIGRFEQQRADLRALLLDGRLAGAGLLDRAALEQDLARPSNDRDPFQDRILRLVDAESWARAASAVGI